MAVKLCAGPWMMTGKNHACRIVLYRAKTAELVVHTQSYDAETDKVSYSGGKYYKLLDTLGAVKCWEEENRKNCETPDGEPHRIASFDFATKASIAG